MAMQSEFTTKKIHRPATCGGNIVETTTYWTTPTGAYTQDYWKAITEEHCTNWEVCDYFKSRNGRKLRN